MFIPEQEDEVISVEQTWIRWSWVVDVEATTELLTDDAEETTGAVPVIELPDNIIDEVFSVKLAFCLDWDCKSVNLLANFVSKESDSSSFCWFASFCKSQLHRVQKEGGSETAVVGVGGIMSIVAVGCEDTVVASVQDTECVVKSSYDLTIGWLR